MYLQILNNHVKRIWHLVQVKYQSLEFFRYWKTIGYLYIMAHVSGEMMVVQVQAMYLWSEPDMSMWNKECGISPPILNWFKKWDGARIVVKNGSSHNKERPLILILKFFDFPAYTTIVQQFLCMAAKGFSAYKAVIYYTLIYLSLRHQYQPTYH